MATRQYRIPARGRGADVRRLHLALLRLGVTVDVAELAQARYGPTTRLAVAAHQREAGEEATGEATDVTVAGIAAAAEANPRRLHVTGVVLESDGRPAVGVTVSAVDRDLRREQPLGEATTREDGCYLISYGPEAFRRAEKATADLLVRVDRGTRRVWDPPLSATLFNAPELAVVDITLPSSAPAPSEYERIFVAVTPLLDDVGLDGLRQDAEVQDITFMVGETGLPATALTHFAVAQKLAAARQLPASFFYALFAQDTLIGAAPSGAVGARFDIDLGTDPTLLYYDVVLLPTDTVRAAVTAAIAAGQVPDEPAGQLDGILARLAADAAQARGYVTEQRPRVLIAQVQSFLSAGSYQKVAAILAEQDYGDLPSLFDKLRQASVFQSPADADTAQAGAALADLLGYQQQVVDAVRQRLGLSRPEDVAQVAALSPAQWRDVLGPATTGLIVGGQPVPAEQVARHATALARAMETRYPTVAFTAQLSRDTSAYGAQRDAIATMLTAHPDFDLATSNVERLLGTHPAAATTGTAGAARGNAKETLKAMQRVFKLAPTYRQTTALLSAGVHAAAGIQAMGRTQFVNTAVGTGEFTAAQAADAFSRASDAHVAASLLAGQLMSGAGALRIQALGGGGVASAKLTAVTTDFPNMTSLFQLADACQCDECRSVHSAAAYLVDVLQFIKNRLVTTSGGGPATKKAKDVLFARRPDLGDLDLSCDNTNTELPYIDLVCELLEDAVAPDAGIPYSGALTMTADPVSRVSATLLAALTGAGLAFTADALVYEPDLAGARVVRDATAVAKLVPDGPNWRIARLRQTYGDPVQVMAAPQYVNQAAYATLAASVYAFGLPFDLAHEETRAYFAQSNVDRSALMLALRAGATPSDADIAAEALGLSDGQRSLIVTANPGGQATIWNVAALPSAGISEVDNFLDRTGLDYATLGTLLGLAWVNPGNAMFIKHLDSGCDLSKQLIENLDDAALDRLHRFIRLWRALVWPMATLDRALRAPRLGNGTLDNQFLVTAWRINQVSGRLGLSTDETINLYDPLTTDRYAQVFVNAAANGTVDPAFTPDAVAANEAAPPGTALTLDAYLPYLALCLGAKVADATRLVTALGPGAIISMANIGTVYAGTRLDKALHLGAADLLTMRVLAAVDPLASPADTLALADAAGTVAAAGTTPTDLRYLLRHEADDLPARELADTAATALLTTLQQGYQAAYAATRPVFDPAATPDENIAGLRDVLAKVSGVGEPELGRFVSIVDGAWTDATQTPAQFVDAMLQSIVDTAPIKATIVASPTDPQRTAMIVAFETALCAYFYATAKLAAAQAAIGPAFALSDDVTAVLLADARLHEPPAAGDRTLGDLLTDDALVDTVNQPPVPPVITPATFDLQYRALRSLAATATLLTQVPLDPDRLAWMLANNGALGWLRLDGLAYQTGVTAATFASWVRLRGALDLINSDPPVVNAADTAHPWTVYGLFDLVLASGTTAGQLTAYLASLAGLDPAVLTALDAAFGFSTPDLSDYADPATIARLAGAAALLRQLGLDLVTATALIQPVLGPAQAGAMRQALKSHYAETDWWGVLGTVQNALRLQKRDALVAYLLSVNPTIRSTDDLFDYFLIDVEMSPCMPTSRIVQAHATVQLFVQRALMGLEPDAVAAVDQDSGWSQWSWMANFRVWEANRKIFLWPENWISPELRDDKSELFVALENTLQQNALTDDSVTDAATVYLESLDDIAHLDVMACYYQDDIHVMHVFARTKGGDPAVYYYRQFQQERSWTPWTRVPLDIEGDHLLAFDRNSRLNLAWPVFTSEPDTATQPTIPDASTDAGQPTDPPQRRWKIQLAISELRNDGWTAKKVSQGALYYPAPQSDGTPEYLANPPDPDAFHAFAIGYPASAQSISVLMQSAYVGSFALTGCRGWPEPTQGGSGFGMTLVPSFKQASLSAERFAEWTARDSDDLAMRDVITATQEIFGRTPGLFTVTYPMQMALIDFLILLLELLLQAQNPVYSEAAVNRRMGIPVGTLMPFFYGDYNRAYVLIPGLYPRSSREAGGYDTGTEVTYSDIDQFVKDVIALVVKYLQVYLDDPNHDLGAALDAMMKDSEYGRLTDLLTAWLKLRYGIRVKNFYHPLTCLLRATLYKAGIPALMRRELQLTKTAFDFDATYQPYPLVVPEHPVEDLDFAEDGAYSSYNWELFFHLPFDIAMRLGADQQFEAARDWFHYIFNPVGIEPATPTPGAPASQRYWITKPFFLTTTADYLAERIDDIMYAIAADPSGATISGLKHAVAQWRDNPFKPDVIARGRPVAYQMAIVVNYVQNLIDWGDNLFRQFTRESITQATQLYILADKLLGPKPRQVPPLVEPAPETYNQLESKVDLFANALLDLENLIPDLGLLPHGGAELPSPLSLSALYFCVPPNDTLLAKWDVVADRLLKIRSCQNIDGVATPLPLFSPPIDPGALVRAVAAGLPISSVLAGLGAPVPAYRFQVLAQQSVELAGQVATLGGELLAALEKRDAEALARLRSGQEIALLDTVRLVKLATIAEANGAIEALTKQRLVTVERKNYYAGQSYMNAWEIAAVALNGVSLLGEVAIGAGYILSGALKLLPDFMVGAAGFGGSPTVNASIGGQTIGNSAEMAVQVLSTLARAADKTAGMAATQGGYQRRQDEWSFQVRLADRELDQIDAQIANAKLHVDMLTADLASHDKQSANAKANDSFLHTKYTNQELYEWMAGQVSSVYFSAYQLALDSARKAERAFGHELATDASFIRPGYWDSLHKGLQTAEALLHDIKRMQAAYLDRHTREYELTKHVSLAQLDPAALISLVNTGSCMFSIPEAVFDLDHPGHYLRRIKTVSLSIPCVAGPYTSVSAKLSLIANRYRKSTAYVQGAANDTDKYAEQPGDERFAYNIGSIESIATSSGQNDAGIFELSFNDERFLPFEGKGAISTWRLELPSQFRQFDYDSISDVVVQVRYTAREGGSGLRKVAEGSLRDLIATMAVEASRTGLMQAFNLRRTFGDEWWQLQQQHQTTLTVTSDRLPFLARGHSPAIDAVTWYARVDGNPGSYQITVDGTPVTLNHDPDPDVHLCVGSSNPVTLDSAFTLAAAAPGLTDLTLLVHYTLGS